MLLEQDLTLNQKVDFQHRRRGGGELYQRRLPENKHKQTNHPEHTNKLIPPYYNFYNNIIFCLLHVIGHNMDTNTC